MEVLYTSLSSCPNPVNMKHTQYIIISVLYKTRNDLKLYIPVTRYYACKVLISLSLCVTVSKDGGN